MDDNLELAFMVIITIGIGLSIGVLLLTKLAEYIFCKDDDEEYSDIVEDNIPVVVSKSDEEKLKNAHKVRTQYPLPPQRKVENTELEITNIKDSIVVTETVYAD
jgi:hypothetical protein